MLNTARNTLSHQKTRYFSSVSNHLFSTSSSKMTVKKDVSEQYQKLTQLEHILKRPDTYIGSTEHEEQVMWVYDPESESMKDKSVKIVPGLFKIFDEILVNAADNKIRDPSMKKIEVKIDPENNLIEVKNDGKGIPIQIHEKEGIYIPELIFGNLLTSSNYDDDEKKVTGGRNGYGAKLCNIFSTEFTVETADKSTNQLYKQTWKNNMTDPKPPKITNLSKSVEYTKISFKPDLEKFHMETLNEDILGVLYRRVYDIAGTVRDVTVTLNGKVIKIKSFKTYVEMYIKSLNAKRIESGDLTPEEAEKSKIIYKKLDDPKAKGRWEIAFGVSDSSFNQISFVNSIATTSGGTHVNYIADQIVDKIGEVLKKKHKNSHVKPFQIRNNMFIFINCLIENPAFSSQTKEQLTTRRQQFGSDCKIPDDFINQVLKTEFISKILEVAQANADKALKRTDGSRKSRITNHPKLEDANKAGTKEGYKCTLILTEGDSALSLAIAGLAVVGRDYYGCFPLRGKMLNVRDASADQITKNAEIQAIKQIMGLQHKKKYDDVTSLRYGRIMIMTDQDTDGSHIKGLIINFLETSFPGLLNVPNFLLEFITPIVKVTITKPHHEVLSFYTMPEYEHWIENESDNYTWKHKYYKGLGTSSQQEAREYFSDLDKHLKSFNSLKDEEKDLIDLAFSKKRADHRKDWLRDFVPGTHIDNDITEIPISDFINKELILFSMADNTRSIPSVLDGLKPGQRKIIYGSFKRNLRTEVRVAQLAGYVSEHTGYHHGEQSLVQTIIGLAQDFVGSNNINLLLPNGAFGTRNMGGKDASAARYIYTELNSITRKLINPADDPLYTYEQDDGANVEPTWYLPVIPLVLVNGAEGIGTGWSTNVPQFNPKDLVANMKRLMAGEELVEMEPWYKGWEGQIQKISYDKYKLYGKIEQLDDNTLAITELPAKVWTSSIKELLLQGLSGTDKTKPWIKDMQEQHGLGIRFIVTLTNEEMAKSKKIGLYERFKLTQSVSLSNMVLFDAQNRIKKYDSVNEIMMDFFEVRLEFYQKRKDNLTKELSNQLEKLSSQARFIKLIIEKKLSINNRKRVVLIEELQELNFPRINKDGVPIFKKADSGDITKDEIEIEEEEEEGEPPVESEDIHKKENALTGYDYLLGMPIWSLTKERYEKLLQQKAKKEDELDELLKKNPRDLWNSDLDEFSKAYETFLKEDEIKRTTLITGKKGGKGRKRAKPEDDDDEYTGGAKKKAKKKSEKLDLRVGELVPIPEYVPPKVKKEAKVKAESTPTPETSVSSGGSGSDKAKKSATVKQEVKEEEPELKTIFGRGNTIFGSPSKPGSGGTGGEPQTFKSKFESAFNSFNTTKDSDGDTPVHTKDSDGDTRVGDATPATGGTESDDDDIIVVSKPKSKAKAKPAAKPAAKAKKAAPAAKPKKLKGGLVDDDLDLGLSDEEIPVTTKRTVRAQAAKSYKTVLSDEDENSFSEEEEDDDASEYLSDD